MTWLLGILACQKVVEPSLFSTDSVPQMEAEPLPSGELSNERFVDGVYPFSCDIPEGWKGESAPKYGSLRLRLIHEVTGTRVEAWFFREVVVEPAPREDCSWAFVDHGHYFDAASDSSSLVATCYPAFPSDSFVFATFRYANGGTWQLETHSPPESLIRSKALGEDIIKGFIFDD